ncbi:helix-turn-helix domain-containing protein [Saccharopolyspora sp. NPDC002686]|uniref:PucR family transcriptional regulator n=1 Tax=Saccharopolyspora sp. NPDC002686 TaxID=3154541 RepID=UPI00331C5FFB
MSRAPVASGSDGDILALVSETARRLNARQPRIARDMSDRLAREIDRLDVDQHLVELLHASVDANTKTIVHVLTNHIPIDHLQPTTAAVEYALRLAQRDIPGNSLVRAYHMGQDYFIQRVFEEVQGLDCAAEVKFEVLRHISQVVYQYIDWISLYVIDAYSEERERWNNARGNVQSSLVHKILAQQPVEASTFEAETGYRLGQFHLAAVVWSTRPEEGAGDLRALEEFLRSLAARWGAGSPPIITAVDRSTAWGWIPMGRRQRAVDVDEVRRAAEDEPGCRIALGLPASGTAGFKRSHEQAQAARAVALASAGRTSAAVSFGDPGVAIVSLLAKDIESTRLWGSEVLGRLACDDENAAVLRETLRVFLLNGENYGRTAEELLLHRNTVKYRLGKVFADGASPSTHDRLDVALALQVCHFLGPRVLRPTTAV